MTAQVEGSGTAIRGGAIRVAGYVLGLLVSLGTATILVRHLGVPNFGRYITVTSLIALVGGVSEAGIYVFGIREFATRPEPERREVMARLLSMRLVLTLVGITCAACFALVVGYRQVVVFGTLVAGAGLTVQVIADVLSISLQAQLRLGRLTVIDVSRRIFALILVAVLALLGASLLPLLAASTVAGALALAMLAWMVRASATIRLSFDRRGWRELLRESIVYALAMSVGAIYFYVTVIVMSLIASANQTGLFATSFRVTQVGLGVPVLLLTAVFPVISRDYAAAAPTAGETVGKVFTVSVICGVGMSLAMAFGAGFIIDVIAGAKGRGATSVLQIQAIVLTASFVSTSSALGLISLRRYRTMLAISSSALLLNIGLGLLLIPSLGARGGALADVLTETLVAVAVTSVLVREVPRHSIRPSTLPPIVLAAAVSATVLFVPVGSVVKAVAATLIYFGVLLLTGTIPQEVIGAVRRAPIIRALSG